MFPSKTAVISGGASTGATFTNSTAIRMDGSSTYYMDTGYAFESQIQDGRFSIGMWIKPDDGQPSSNEYLFGSSDATGGSNATSSIAIIINQAGMFSGRLEVQIRVESSVMSIVRFVDNSTTFADGAASDYSHILVVFNRVVITVYVNGSALTALGDAYGDGDISGLTFGNYKNEQRLALSAYNDDGSVGGGYSGFIDEAAFWDTNLDSDDASEIYNSGTPNDLTALSALKPIAWWRFEENTGTGVINEIDSDTYKGTLSHSDAWTTTIP